MGEGECKKHIVFNAEKMPIVQDEQVIEEMIEEVQGVEVQKERAQPEQAKLSYEQVYQIAQQATQQLDMLQQEFNKNRDESLFIRLDFLFKVLTNKASFPVLFVVRCANEIELLLTIPDQKK